MSSAATMQHAKTDARQSHVQQNSSELSSEKQIEPADSRAQARQLKVFQHMAQHSARAVQLNTKTRMMNSLPSQRMEDEALVQEQSATVQRIDEEAPAQKKSTPAINNTGLPDNLKSGIESLSGISMDHVKVHYNASQPAQLNALAYAQGSEIHVAPGQEQHLPHEAWHVVQQAQGRVRPTMQLKAGVAVNDDVSLETEADVMGSKALTIGVTQKADIDSQTTMQPTSSNTIQAMTGFEAELHVPVYSAASAERAPAIEKEDTALSGGERQQIQDFLAGGLDYGRTYAFQTDGYYDISADHGPYKKTHNKLITELIKGGYISADFFARSMTNIEYRTPPVEERSPGADAQMNNIATAVKTHSASTAAKSTGDVVQDLDAPASNLKTGVPKTALDKLVSAGSADVKGAVTSAKSEVNPFVYYQTTTGVLPSEVPELFKESAIAIRTKAGGYSELGPREKGTYVILAAAHKIGQDLMQSDVAAFIRGEAGVKSLTGWITLLTQYMLSYKLERTDFLTPSSTTKNLVGYLSKTPLHDSSAALPPAVRPDISTEPIKEKWMALFRGLIAAVEGYDLEAATGLTHVDKPAGEVPDPSKWLARIVQQSPGGEIASGHALGFDGGQEKLKPALSIKGEQAIPLEDRYSFFKASAEDMSPENVDTYMKAEWAKAVARRQASTATPETKTSAQKEDIDDAYERVLAALKKLIGEAETKYKIPEVSLTELKKRLAKLPTFIFLMTEKEFADLGQLHKDTYTAINAKLHETNTEQLKWIDAVYLGIDYSWKDAENCKPKLKIEGSDIFVTLDDKQVKATIEGAYLVYQFEGKSNKITRIIAGVKTYVSADAKQWIA
jgi:hypothetical protein